MKTNGDLSFGSARRGSWALFLALWTLVAAGAIALLATGHGPKADGKVFFLRGDDPANESFGNRVHRALLLAHLSLYRAYPWIILAPHVVWLASRFSLERGRLRSNLPIQLSAAALFALSCQGLNYFVTATQPSQIILAVTETATENSSSTNSLRRGVDRVTRILQLSTNLPSDRPINPGDLDRLFGAFSNAFVRLGTNPPGISHSALHRAHSPSPSATWTNSASSLEDFFPTSQEWPSRTNSRSKVSFEMRKSRDAIVTNPFLGSPRVLAAVLDLCVFGSLLGLGHAVHFYRRFQERERLAASLEGSLTKARLHALQAQLHPHFLFNTLNSIASLLRQNPRAAEEMLTSLSDLLRLALSQSSRQQSRLSEELRFLDLYWDIQRMRFGDRLKFEKIVEPESLDCLVPTLLLQPLVENAIRHGIEPTGKTGQVRVLARVRDAQLELQVVDDGAGSPALLAGQIPLGVGLSNVRERLRSLFGPAATLEFLANASGGLTVKVILPVRNEEEPPGADLA